MSVFYSIVFWLSIIVIHEFGHYTYFWIVRKKRPSMTTNGLLINIGSERENLDFTLKQYILFNESGIILGAIPLVILGNYEWFLIYIIACMVDLTNIFQSYEVKSKYRISYQTKIRDIIQLQLKHSRVLLKKKGTEAQG